MKIQRIGFAISKPKFMQRRRTRQAADELSARMWTLELAELRMQLLVAMADIDGRIVDEEIVAIHDMVHILPLLPDDRMELGLKVSRWLNAPPDADHLVASLKPLASVPALGRALITDLARVAAADHRADPSEVELLHLLCEALDLPPIRIPVPDPPADDDATDSRARHAPSATDPRIREAVRLALNATYARQAVAPPR